MNMVQQQFAGYFASLAISKVDGAENPTYNIDVVFLMGPVTGRRFRFESNFRASVGPVAC